MQTIYKHTQIGRLMIYLMLLEILIFSWLAAALENKAGTIITLLAVLLILSQFSALTVIVDRDFIKIRFGAGIFRKNITRSQIISTTIVRNPWYYGFGIRYTPTGWIYNVSGLDAIELFLKNGKKIRIGTDDAKNLKRYIDNN